jgi:hypothetical protein
MTHENPTTSSVEDIPNPQNTTSNVEESPTPHAPQASQIKAPTHLTITIHPKKSKKAKNLPTKKYPTKKPTSSTPLLFSSGPLKKPKRPRGVDYEACYPKLVKRGKWMAYGYRFEDVRAEIEAGMQEWIEG